MMKKELIRYENIHCSMDGQTCFNGLFFRAFEGQICCVIVNNTIEKKNFLQLLYGNLKPDYGWTYYKGKKIVSFKTKEQMLKQTAFIGRNKGIFSELSVAENIFVASGRVPFWKRVNPLCRHAPCLLKDLDISIPLLDKAHMLDPGMQKQAELLRAFVSGCHLAVITDIEMIMTEEQLKNFFHLVIKLKDQGMSFLYVVNSSTKLYEYADEITIIKNGRTIGHMYQEDSSKFQTYMELFEKSPKNTLRKNDLSQKQIDKKTVLEFRNVKLPDLPVLNLSLNAGEVLNILDLDSTECRNILPILQGECGYEAGRILLNGKEYSFQSVHQSIRDGIAFIEARPMEEMLFADMTVLDHMTFMIQRNKKKYFLRKKYRKMTRNLLEGIFSEDELMKKTYMVSDECKLKLLYYRWIFVRPQILVCIKPFSSVDFQMRQITINLLKEVLKSGIAVIIITNQIAEAYTMEGKNITFHDGTIAME
jgi:ABC-type sugar transport system ATPase subunit